MQFNIKCSTFVRLASICDFFEPYTDEGLKEKCKTVRLEISNGKMMAIATNVKVAAIEFIGTVPAGLNEVCHVVVDDTLLNQCRAESMINGILTINTIPQIATASATTTSGWAYPGNPCLWFDETPLNEWREWPDRDRIKKSDGIMMWNLYHVEALLESSPSGKVYFPKFIDALKPIVMRDKDDPNWVGLFVPKPNGDIQHQEAELPDWWR